MEISPGEELNSKPQLSSSQLEELKKLMQIHNLINENNKRSPSNEVNSDKNHFHNENFDHEKLFNCLKTKKNWIMTYNNCDYIKELYSDYKIIETNWSYCMNKSKKSSEIIIIG